MISLDIYRLFYPNFKYDTQNFARHRCIYAYNARQKKPFCREDPMNRTCCYLLIVLLLFLSANYTACRQPNTSKHFNLVLENGVGATSELDRPDSPMEWGKYHPKNLLDGDSTTCWCEGDREGYGTGETVYLSVPWHVESMSIRNGYHKSEKLYTQNSRVKKADIQFYVAVYFEGYATQAGLEYTLFPTGEKATISLNDKMNEIMVPLDIDHSGIEDMAQKVLEENRKKPVRELRVQDGKDPVGGMRLVAGLTIREVYQGSKYKDTCISEISFPFTKKPVINEMQNIVTVGNRKLVSDMDSVFQLVDTSPGNYWAIIIRMPAKAEGRVETEYRLYYLPALQRIMPAALNIGSQSLTGFTDIYGKPVKKGEKVYLQFINKAGKEDTLLLNPYNLTQFIEKD